MSDDASPHETGIPPLTHDLDARTAVARDWSGLVLVPEAVATPREAGDVAELLAWSTASGTAVTAAGGQTSTTGASITDRGVLLSLRGMSAILDIDPAGRTMRVEPGALVGDIKRAAADHGLLFAPDPTSEEECTIGGSIACNASGARSLRYGAMRQHVVALRVALASGAIIDVRRPRLEKNTVGLALAHDPVDWFVGSEGILGVVVEAELALLPLPAQVIGLAIPFSAEHDALRFVVAAREATQAAREAVHGSPLPVAPRCLEYLDAGALAIAAAAGGESGWAAARALVYTEEEFPAGAEPDLDGWLALAERHGALVDEARAYTTASELREARRMRHAVPITMTERASSFRDAGGRRVSTDWAVPFHRLAAVLDAARGFADAAGLEPAVTYGHAGNGHPHQNFVARDAAELARIEGVVGQTLRLVIAEGGTVAAEHGIGKLKRRWLPLQASALQTGVMRAVKRELDPAGILAPGNVLDPE